jgi:hypothetical protein
MAYDGVEPLDAAGQILRGFSGPRPEASLSWKNPEVQQAKFRALVGLTAKN